MKKLLLLLCVPLIGFGQGSWTEGNECISGNCDNGYGTYHFYVEGATDMGDATYEGEFIDGEFNGTGNVTCDLDRFEGETGGFYIIGNWKNGKLHGNVIIIERYQSYLCGDVPPDKDGLHESAWESTYTTLLHETVYKYSGQYIDSLRDGFGLMSINSFVFDIDPDDDVLHIPHGEPWTEFYIGKWKNGMKNGFGRYLYSDGDIYEGEWINDKKEGKGKMIYNDGSIEDGIWENGEFIGE